MKFPHKVKCVIFDMDGVIIDSEDLHKKAYYNTFKSLDVVVSDDLYKSLTGSSTLNAFQKLVKHFQLKVNPDKLVLQKREYYINLFENDPNLSLVEGVKDLIVQLHDRGIKMVLASSSAMENINRVFNRFALDPFFSAKISGADLKASKPNPEIFEKAALLAKTPKENCVIIEDSDNGVEAANQAGIFVFGYQNPKASDQTLENANQKIKHFNEVCKFLF